MTLPPAGRAGRWLLLAVGGTLLVTGCRITTPSSSPSLPSTTSAPATANVPTLVTVPARKADTDPTYEIRSTASVINDRWYDGTFGKVTVTARGLDGDNWTPLLTGTLHLADGKTVECRQHRSTFWSKTGEFMDLDLRCANGLDLSIVRSVDVISAHGAAERSMQPGS